MITSPTNFARRIWMTLVIIGSPSLGKLENGSTGVFASQHPAAKIVGRVFAGLVVSMAAFMAVVMVLSR